MQGAFSHRQEIVVRDGSPVARKGELPGGHSGRAPENALPHHLDRSAEESLDGLDLRDGETIGRRAYSRRHGEPGVRSAQHQ